MVDPPLKEISNHNIGPLGVDSARWPLGPSAASGVGPQHTAKTGFRQGVAPATHLRNQQRLREALGCVRWLREVAA